jgi:Predicted metal-dependent hydrolases related to alanyl-tRNA synthetase HxxxH domain
MRTKQLYYEKPYLKEAEAFVLAVEKNGVILDTTIAYPEGGGQPGDRGMINGIPFSDTRHEGDEIVHIMDPNGLKSGDKVTISLDWDHRYFYMKEHAAQHLLSGLFYNLFSIGTVAVHQGEEVLTIETDRAEIDEETLFSLEAEAGVRIRENRAISAMAHLTLEAAEALGLRRSIKVDDDVRIVTIDGVDRIACGGLHTATTGEIGELSYVGAETIRGHVRTIWKVADKALAERRLYRKTALAAGRLLSASGEEILPAIEKLAGEKEALDAEVRRLNHLAAELAYRQNKDSKVFLSPVPVSFFNDIADRECFIIHETDEKGLWLYHGSAETFMQIKTAAWDLAFKGGGRAPLFQGMVGKKDVQSLYAAVRELMNE